MTPKTQKLPLQRLDRVAWLLDNSIKIPGVNYRIGLDGLIGLIPGIGDATGTLLSMYILAEGARAGIPKPILLRMAWNIGVDSLIGAIPLVGDLFDMTWKANARNVRLLKEYNHASHPMEKQSRWFLAAIGTGLVLVVLATGMVTFFLIRLLLGWVAD